MTSSIDSACITRKLFFCSNDCQPSGMAKFMMLQKSYMLILTQFIINHYLFSKWMGESKKKINAHLY